MRPVSSRQLRLLILACLWATWSGLNSRAAIALEVDGIQVELENKASPAMLAAKTSAPFKLELQVDPNSERKPLVVRIKLPVTGRGAWPAADVEVRDAAGRAVVVSRSGIEWHILRIPLPPQHARYFVQTAEPLGGRSPRIAESRRQLTDTKSGLRIHLPQWFDHREAALSIRFDDSHPTHLSKAAPILDEYGFRGTFMVNPGSSEPGSRRRSSFADHRAGWEALARQDCHEFANHSAHHRGANGDADMEAEIGEAARTIWPLFPHRSRLLALNLGGGTLWSTSHTLRHYLDKYHLFDASSGSLGMDDSYGGRVDQLRRSLDQHIQRGLWCRIHYHYIGEGLSSSEANFRAAMEEIKSRAARLWIAGMADVHKYATERAATSLDPVDPGGNEFAFRLNCATDSTLYDQALTVEMTPPEAWSPHRITVRSDSGERIALRTAKVGDRTVLRFETAARNEIYRIRLQ